VKDINNEYQYHYECDEDYISDRLIVNNDEEDEHYSNYPWIILVIVTSLTLLLTILGNIF
jgi:hypothetical protein